MSNKFYIIFKSLIIINIQNTQTLQCKTKKRKVFTLRQSKIYIKIYKISEEFSNSSVIPAIFLDL